MLVLPNKMPRKQDRSQRSQAGVARPKQAARRATVKALKRAADAVSAAAAVSALAKRPVLALPVAPVANQQRLGYQSSMPPVLAAPVQATPTPSPLLQPPATPLQPEVGDYMIGEDQLGRGGFAVVVKAEWRDGLGLVACKRLRDSKNTAENRLLFRRECELHLRLHHPNVVHCFGGSWAADEDNPMLIIEYCQRGSLRKALADNELPDRIFLARGIAHGMAYLHKSGVCLSAACLHRLLSHIRTHVRPARAPQVSFTMIWRPRTFFSAAMLRRSSLTLGLLSSPVGES